MKMNPVTKKHAAGMCQMFAFMVLLMAASCSGGTTGPAQVVLAVEPISLQALYPEVGIFMPDTVEASSDIHAYAKGVQRYAAAWLYLGQEELADTLSGLQIQALQGEDIKGRISQEQRDSVIMDFIKFARRSSIPYHEHVKDFDLKMMKIR